MTDLTGVVESLHPHELKVLRTLSDASEPLIDEDLAKQTALDVGQVGAALGRLQLKELVEVQDEKTYAVVSLTDVGKRYIQQGSSLSRIVAALRAAQEHGATLTIKDLQTQEGLAPGEISGIIGILKQEGTIVIGGGGALELIRESATAGALGDLLGKAKQHKSRELGEYEIAEQRLIEKFAQKRGDSHQPFRVDTRVMRRFGATQLGKSVANEKQDYRLKAGAGSYPATGGDANLEYAVNQLTPQMLKDGSWRNVRFRKYTIDLKPERPKRIGKKHPYREFLDHVKGKFVGMGFTEVRGPLVENEFWDMDALFMPQFHPARDIHDVYFVKEPTHSAPIPETIVQQVQQAHENGWKTGSTGWGDRFDPVRTRRLILRSQGTAVSARTLAARPKVPGKFF
jgi:phenylalanyl-tRNA synthetase alpha chain